MTRLLLIFFLIYSFLFISCKRDFKGEGELRKYKIEYNGFKRKYFVYLPRDFTWKKSYPVVFALHGRFGTAKGMQKFTGFNVVADARNMIIVYPQGYRRSWEDEREDGPAAENNVDDVGFMDKLITELPEEFPMLRDSLYVCGMSNGGFMTLKLACSLSGKIAAAASVTGLMAEKPETWCNPESPVPVMIMTGTEDPVVPYEGGEIQGGSMTISTEEALAFWKSQNQCSDTSEVIRFDAVDDETSIEETAYYDCVGRSVVIQYDIVGGGHTWPGGQQYLPKRSIGEVSDEIEAEVVIADFFMDHSLEK